PIFNADKIKSPILLIQGSADPWCTLAESDLMYSALKVQGKEVVQIRWIGEGHGLADQGKKIVNYTIWLEWFEKWLKGRAEAWDDRVRKD
ncbi:MAG: prolyl oligopeptidase family serine peptidase, partial [Planctomycetes bacterium]|nr:prolyl oligopeptidase family serine peptidase [Planctomycetota bacterium]